MGLEYWATCQLTTHAKEFREVSGSCLGFAKVLLGEFDGFAF